VRKCRNDAGGDPDHIGQAAFVARIRGDTARYGQGIQQMGIRLEQ
jgi:hypothetical protein